MKHFDQLDSVRSTQKFSNLESVFHRGTSFDFSKLSSPFQSQYKSDGDRTNSVRTPRAVSFASSFDYQFGVPDFNASFVQPITQRRLQNTVSNVLAPSRYDDIFNAAGKAYGVNPLDLKLTAVVESGLNPNSVGPKTEYGQAHGIMQLTPETARRFGVRNPLDPADAIYGAARLKRHLLNTAGGNSAFAERLYYGGENTRYHGRNTHQYAANKEAIKAGIRMAAPSLMM